MDLNQKTIKYFDEQIALLEGHLKRVHKDPSMEKVHKLRVTIRRIRSVLELSKADIRPLKKLAKNLGRMRDLDVAIENARHYKLDPKKLIKKRQKFTQDTDELLGKSKREKILTHLNSLSEDLHTHSRTKIKFPTNFLQSELLDWTGKIKDEELHDLRITLKKVRYLFEASGRPTGYLKKVQDQLGHVHDLEVLEEYFKNNPQITKDKNRKILSARKVATPAVKRALRELKTFH